MDFHVVANGEHGTLKRPFGMGNRSSLWAIWAFVAFVVLNIQARPNAEIAATDHPAPGLGALLVLLRDDGDTRRYFAYASAMLGRPYDGFYVRSGADASDTQTAHHELITPDGPLIPWRDFEVEYPPGVLIAALPPCLLTSDFPLYHFLFSLEMELMLTAAAALGVASADRLRPGLGDAALGFSVIMLVGLGVIAARRYDALVALTLAGAVHGLVARRAAVSGLALAVGIVAKGAPVLLAPIGALQLFVAEGKRSLARATVAGGVTLALGLALYLWIAGAHALDALAYHADRPIQIESPYGAVLLIAHYFDPGLLKVVHTFGSHNISAPFEPPLRKLAFVLSMAALLGVYLTYARGMLSPALREPDAAYERAKLTLACGSAALIAFIVLGKVFSPQYLTWLMPLGALSASMSSERSRALLFVGVAAAQLEYPFLYQTAGPFAQPLLGGLALIRAALLIAAAVSLISDAYPFRRRPLGA
jgi:hypothetical protein